VVSRSIPVARRVAQRPSLFLGVWAVAAVVSAVLLLHPRLPAPAAPAAPLTVAVRAPRSGVVAEVDVTPDQRVRAGDVLARIEVPGLAEEIADTQAGLAGGEAETERLRAEAESGVLRATASGIVGDLVPHAGEWVQAGVPVLTVIEPPVRAVASVPGPSSRAF
jgi:multidrug resistance efflux pump